MDPVSFKNALQDAKPASEELAAIGLHDGEVAEILCSFDLYERAKTLKNSLPDFALSDLFARFDPSRVEVGLVRFRDIPESAPYGFIIGEVEADYLAFEVISGEITVRDLTDPHHTIWKCAKGGEGLLSALAEAAKYLSACLVTDQSGSEFQRETLGRCTRLAGGVAYGDFYRMLLGAGSVSPN